MKTISNFLILTLMLVLATSCEKNVKNKNIEFDVVSVSDIKFDLVFPKELWDMIINSAPPTISKSLSTYEMFESLTTEVSLLDSSKEVFGGKNYRFDFKDFGGEVDFNNYLKRDVVGSFKIKFNFPHSEDEVQDIHVFYLSWSKQYTLNGELFGNGCGYFYDVTSHFNKEVFKKDLKLHTNNYRYFDMVGGRLYFVNYSKSKIQISQITLTDSSLEKRMCEDKL